MQTAIPLRHFLHWEKQTPDNEFLRQPIYGRWHTFTFAEAGQEVRRIATALKSQLPEGSHIAVLSKNCAHWIIADLAIMLSGNVSVPIYPTLSAKGIEEILIHSKSKAILLGKLDNFELQRDGIPNNLLRISFPYYGLREGLLWEDLIGSYEPAGDFFPGEDELATIMYSSGTTGTPKGVLLTHGAFGFVGENVARHLHVTAHDRFFSYLPLSHIAERALMEMVALHAGSTISFTESLDQFQGNLQHEKPTIFGGVPRIYAKFQEGILQKLPEKKLNALLGLPLISGLIKRTIRKKLGLSHCRIVVCGAAPSPVSQLQWFHRLGIAIGEIYGLTENTAFSHANYRKIKIGTVGEPWPGCDFKLSNDGEILVRHKALMKGYYNDDETTQRVFTDDGYLRTGDSGTVDDEGFLTITGRIKDQFKTDKGKFIAPAPIELDLLSNIDLDQVCVVGMGLPQPVALAVLSGAGKQKSAAALTAGLIDTLNAVNRDLEPYERIEKIIIVREAWSMENGMLTPSLKLKRTLLESRYLPHCKAWYEQPDTIVWE